MKYSVAGKKNTLRARWSLCVAAFFAFGSCTTVDDRLGADLIPVNQRMETEVTSPSSGVHTFLYREDSLPSSRTGKAWLGRTVDEAGIFGGRTSSVVLQFEPTSLPYSDAEGYGIDPIVDSALIVLVLSDVRGDTTLVQNFDVWEITDTQEALTRDTTYYSNFPIERYKGRRLFGFSHTGRRNVNARLFPTAAGKEYLDSIVRLGWDDYTTDSLFRLKFQGLYIAPAEDSPAQAALYGADLTASGMRLYVRNHDTLDTSAIYDTLVTTFMFRDSDAAATSSSSAVTWNNVSINMTSFDYTGSVLGALETATSGFTDTLPGSTPLKTTYVQTGGGVGTMLRFTDELIAEIRALGSKTDAYGTPAGKDIAISQAVMKIGTGDTSTAALDRSITRLGSYLSPKSLVPIPDYYYSYEVYQNQLLAQNGSSSTYSLPYGGYLNRSNGYYELDITSYVQQLARQKTGDPGHKYIAPAFFIAPEAYSLFGTGQTVLKGFGSDQPISIRITYTIVDRSR